MNLSIDGYDMFLRSIFLLLIFLFAAFDSNAQYHIDSWTTEDGLPQNQINDIIQTQDGYLWLSTFNGLVRYDGVRFKVFNPGNTRELLTNRLWRFFEAPNGDLWVTTENSGVIRYSNKKFTTYTIDDGLPDNQVSIRLFKENTSFYLIFYSPKGAVKFFNERFVPCNSGELGSFKGNGIQTSPTTVWYVENERLHKIENGREVSSQPINGFNPDSLNSLYEDRKGDLWLKMNSWEVKRYKDNVIVDYHYHINSFYEDRNGNLWACTFGNGLGLYKDEEFIFLTTSDGLLDNDIWSVYQDRENNLWIGTAGGLNCRRNTSIKTYSEKDGISAKSIYPIYQDSKGDIWIGSLPGLTKYSAGVFTQQNEIITDWEKERPHPYWVKAINEDRDGNLWIGSNNGVVRIKDGKVFANREGPIFKTMVNAIFQDHSGVIWFGTTKGLVKYQNNLYRTYTRESGLASDVISTIFEDSSNTLWIGTQFGLSSMNGETFRNYGKKEGLIGNLVRVIYEDSDHTLWIGTYDGGLNRLKDGYITSYTTREGLYDNGVSQILEDDKENFWISCNLGIYRIKKRELNQLAEGKIKSLSCVAYNGSDGMLSSECNGGYPAGIKTRDGHFWFPTTNGIVVIDPTAIPVSEEPIPVVMEESLIDNESVPYEKVIRLEQDKENLEIHYTGLSFVMPNQCRFKYRLEGLDRDWIDAGSRRTAYYSHIPPGQYIFSVIGANRDGIWNLTGAKVAVIVVPPFWQTWWFSTLVTSLLVSAVTLFYRIRISALEQKRKTQELFSQQLIESQENERKRLAAELHDSLAQSLLVIKHRALMTIRAHNKNGNIIEHLNEISTTTDLAINEVSELSYNLRPYQLDKLGLARAIEAMLERVSGSSGVIFSTSIDPIENIFTQQAEISIYRIIQECVNNIVKHSGASRAIVKLTKTSSDMSIIIADNGKGFNSELVGSKSSMKSGFGLTGIAERARMLSGKHTIESKPGTGTTITVQISLRNIRHERKDNHNNS